MAYDELREAYTNLVTSTNREEVKTRYDKFFEVMGGVKKRRRLEKIYLLAREGDKKNLLVLLRKAREMIEWTDKDEDGARFLRNMYSGELDVIFEGIGLPEEVLQNMQHTYDPPSMF